MCEICKLCILLYCMRKFSPLLSQKWFQFLLHNTKVYKIGTFDTALFSAFLNILQPKLATLYTNFEMLFRAIVMKFVLHVQIKIWTNAGIAY